jgi:hypothetical protein
MSVIALDKNRRTNHLIAKTFLFVFIFLIVDISAWCFKTILTLDEREALSSLSGLIERRIGRPQVRKYSLLVIDLS